MLCSVAIRVIQKDIMDNMVVQHAWSVQFHVFWACCALRTIHVFWDFDPQSPSADPTGADSTRSCAAGGETSARFLRIYQDPYSSALSSFHIACTGMKFQETVQEHAKEDT